MFHSKKPSTMNSHDERSSMGDSGLVLTTDPKPRLRWTVELHARFIDAVTQLGGPDKATPKTIMRVMGVKGLTLYHLKSHLQKFRLGKQPHKEFTDQSIKQELQRNSGSSSNVIGRSMNDNSHMVDAIKMQMEVQRRLHEQLEVQRHLQLRIEAQGKYMQSILAKACQTLVSENVGCGGSSFKTMVPCFQDLNICGGDQLDLEQDMDDFLPVNDDICFEKKESSSYSDDEKSPLLWSEDLQLHVVGPATASTGFKGERVSDLDSISDLYDAKSLQLSSDSIGDKNFDSSVRLELPFITQKSSSFR